MLKTDDPLVPSSGTAADASPAEKEREHLDYLERMAAEGVVPHALAEKAAAVWRAARDAAGSGLPIPAAVVNEDDAFYYYWSEGDHQLSCEIPLDEPMLWVYSLRTTDDFWGEEVASDRGLPSRVANALTLIATSAR